MLKRINNNKYEMNSQHNTDKYGVNSLTAGVIKHCKYIIKKDLEAKTKTEYNKFHVYKGRQLLDTWSNSSVINAWGSRMASNILKDYGYTEVKTSYAKGYISAIDGDYIEDYKGRYGEGFKLHTYASNTNNYHYITYFVKEG